MKYKSQQLYNSINKRNIKLMSGQLPLPEFQQMYIMFTQFILALSNFHFFKLTAAPYLSLPSN